MRCILFRCSYLTILVNAKEDSKNSFLSSGAVSPAQMFALPSQKLICKTALLTLKRFIGLLVAGEEILTCICFSQISLFSTSKKYFSLEENSTYTGCKSYEKNCNSFYL